MDRLSRLVLYSALSLYLSLLNAPAWAGDMVWTGSGGVTGCTEFASGDAISSCIMAYYTNRGATGTSNSQRIWTCPKEITVDEMTDSTPPELGWTVTIIRKAEGTYTWTTPGPGGEAACTATSNTFGYALTLSDCPEGHTWNYATGNCDPPSECIALAGQPFGGFFEASSPELVICNDPSEGNQCAAQSHNAFCDNGLCYGDYTYTGADCDTEEHPDEFEESNPDITENCIQTPDGIWHCVAKSDPNCGFVNGLPWCAEDIPDGECVFLGQTGGMMCEGTATSPPAPSTGDGTGPATPDSQIDAIHGGEGPGTYNYYTANTVNNSGNPTQGGNTGDGQSGSDGEDGEFPDGSVGGGGSCSSAPTCEGNAMLCGILTQTWRTSCMEEPGDSEILAAAGLVAGDGDDPFIALGTSTTDFGGTLGAVTGWLGAQTCPADLSIDLSSVNLGVIAIPLSQLCWLASLIGVFVYVASWMLSIRIVLEAF